MVLRNDKENRLARYRKSFSFRIGRETGTRGERGKECDKDREMREKGRRAEHTVYRSHHSQAHTHILIHMIVVEYSAVYKMDK